MTISIDNGYFNYNCPCCTFLTKALELAVKYISEACIHAPVYIQNKDWWIKAVKGEVDTLPVFKPWVKTTSLLQKQQELSS